MNLVDKKIYTFLILLICVFNSSAAQPDSIHHPFIAGIRYHYGFIIPHSKMIEEISHSNPWIIETDFSWLQLGNHSWDYCHCYPRLGFSLSYINYDNPEIIGHAYTLVPYVEPFFSYTSRINLSYRAGLGIAYMDNPFDSIDNPNNYFYSTNISFVVLLNISMNIKINQHVNFRLSGYYNHISNSGVQEPNKGINFPTGSLGIDYTFTPSPIPVRPRDKKELYPRIHRAKIYMMGTAKSVASAENKRYPVYGLGAEYGKVVARISALCAGIEWVSDGAVKEKLSRDNDSTSHHRIAVLAGHELLIGRFTFTQKLGIYLYAPHKAKNPVYQRYGLTYTFRDKIFFGLDLKSHLHVADFMDARIGIIL